MLCKWGNDQIGYTDNSSLVASMYDGSLYDGPLVHDRLMLFTVLGFKPQEEKTLLIPIQTISLSSVYCKFANDVSVFVSSFPQAQYGPLHYRRLEIMKLLYYRCTMVILIQSTVCLLLQYRMYPAG